MMMENLQTAVVDNVKDNPPILKIEVTNIKSRILYDAELYNEYFAYCMSLIDKALSFYLPNYENNKDYNTILPDGTRKWDGKLHLFNPYPHTKYYLQPFEFLTGKIYEIITMLYQLGYKVELIDHRVWHPRNEDKWDWNDKFPPYKYQEDAANNAIREGRGIILAATSSGKCINKDSYIFVHDKGMFKIGSLLENIKPKESKDYIVDISTPLTNSKRDTTSKIYRDGESLSWSLTTRFKYNICGTPIHRVKIINSKTGNIEWETLSNINKKDYLVLVKNQQVFGCNTSLSLEDAYLYGLLVGDGSYTTKNQIRLTTQDKHIQDVWDKYWEKRNIKTHIYLDNRSINKKELVVCSQKERERIYKHGFFLVQCHEKTVPNIILQSPKDRVCAFIRGLYETDGWLEENGAICIAFSSKQLIVELQLILLNIGIISGYRVKKTKCKDSYVLSIYGEYTKTFIKEIGFDEKGYKIKNYIKYLPKIKGDYRDTNYDIVPHQNQRLETIREIIKKHHVLKNIFKSSPITDSALRSWIKGIKKPKKRNLKNFTEWIKKLQIKELDYYIKELEVLLDEDFYYIEVLNKEQVLSDNYDFVVPNTHSFNGNGFINHNTNLATRIIQKIGLTPTLFFVTTRELLEQAKERIESLLGVEVGKVGDGHCDIKDITVCTIQTCFMAFGREGEYKQQLKSLGSEFALEKEKNISKDKYQQIQDLVKEAKVIIADECHHSSSDTCRMILELCENATYRFGLSATVKRDDGMEKVIEGLFGKYLSNISISYIIERGQALSPEIYLIPVDTPLGLCENYQSEYKAYITENQTRNEMIAQISAECVIANKSTLVLIKYIPHGEKLLEMIKEKVKQIGGEPEEVVFMHGKMKDKIRSETMQKLKNKEIKCCIASSLADEGLDVPCLEVLVLAVGGKSYTKTIQRIGRVVRIDKKNKNKVPVVFDFIEDRQAKFLRKHSIIRKKIYESEPAFKVIDLRRKTKNQSWGLLDEDN